MECFLQYQKKQKTKKQSKENIVGSLPSSQ